MEPWISLPIVLRGLAAGFLGTLCMYACMWGINRSGLAKANMPRALGSLITKNSETALWPGIAMHFTMGSILGVVYAMFLRLFPIAEFSMGPLFGYQELMLGAVFASTAFGLFAGVLHGLVVSAALIILIAERHPVPEFREAGFEVAGAHVAGHLVYGLAAGFFLAMLR